MARAVLIKGIKVSRGVATDIIKFLYMQASRRQPEGDGDIVYLDDSFNDVSTVLKMAADDFDDDVIVGFKFIYGDGYSNRLFEITELFYQVTENDFYNEVDKLNIRQLLPTGQHFRMFVCIAS